MLLIAAVIALAWANSPFRGAYVGLWNHPSVHFGINDGLMTIFFFVVGLEIRREMHEGELRDLRRAALPVVAAVGGMIVPALIYFAINAGRPSVSGWGVPMATDIAFAVGALALMGKRVTPSMRILLLALAVIDDVGAIIVIAVFYAADLAPLGFAIAAAGIAAIAGLQKLKVRHAVVYALPAAIVWVGLWKAGIHPTLAGVVVGLMTPVAVIERLVRLLHGWVAYAIMPVFALANAGVTLGSASFEGDGMRVFQGVVLGLAIGKPAGIVGLSWAMRQAGLVTLPAWSQIGVVGAVAGIGFTMALFVAQLAFPPGALLETAKLAILVGSALAAVIGFVGSRALSLDAETTARPS